MLVIIEIQGLAIPLQYDTPFSMVGLSLSNVPNVRPWLVLEIQNVWGETHAGPEGINFWGALIFVFTHNMSCWEKHAPPMPFTLTMALSSSQKESSQKEWHHVNTYACCGIAQTFSRSNHFVELASYNKNKSIGA